MTSINTNIAAMTALQTLQQTNSALESTQSRISTGFRVAEAKDNAAYWSIATTMRSDNMAMSAVKDSLGIGAATVDTAYTALDSTKDVLNEIKAKLTAATQQGVDRSKIQDEVSQLQEQLKSIAASASFSGQNWLSIDSSPEGYDYGKQVVSNISRDAAGTLSIGTITVDTSKLTLFDANPDSKGILSQGAGNVSTGGLVDASEDDATANSVAATAASLELDGSFTAVTFADADDGIEFSVNVNGTAKTVVLDAVKTATNATPGTIANVTELVANLNAVLTAGTENYEAFDDGGSVGFRTTATGEGQSIQLIGVAALDGNASGFVSTAGLSVADSTTTAAGADARGATVRMDAAFTGPMTFDMDDTLTFDIAVDGGPATTVTINKATVNAALSDATSVPPVTVTDGTIASAADFVTVLNRALSDASVTGAVASADGDNILIGSLDTAPGTSAIEISEVEADTGAGVDGIDLNKEGLTADDIKAYISVVDTAISKVTAGASTLGAIQNRIDMQTQFVSNLMDTITGGIGTLVDADMTEESTRLKALQTQQQLGVQALSIANNSTQAIMQLFQ